MAVVRARPEEQRNPEGRVWEVPRHEAREGVPGTGRCYVQRP